MSEALEKLRQEKSPTKRHDTLCVCGEPVEVALVVNIRERGGSPRVLLTRSHRFCATCAVKRTEEMFRV